MEIWRGNRANGIALRIAWVALHSSRLRTNKYAKKNDVKTQTDIQTHAYTWTRAHSHIRYSERLVELQWYVQIKTIIMFATSLNFIVTMTDAINSHLYILYLSYFELFSSACHFTLSLIDNKKMNFTYQKFSAMSKRTLIS